MIRRLQRRMILVVLSGLLLASAGVVLAINWMNWSSLANQAGQVLDMLEENDGKRPVIPELEGIWENQEALPDRREGMPKGGLEALNNRNRGGKDLMNAASMSTYYSAEINGEGRVLSW